ncbi:MAG: OmpH family outer membrane protein [Ignavibacteria bacterium]
MKKIILIFSFFLLLFSSGIYSQISIGYVDSDTIMKDLPDAQDAQASLDALIQEWQDELAKLERNWQQEYDTYEERKLIMSDQKRIEKEQELIKLEDEINQFRQGKFGVNGELFKKQDEVMKPVQNKIFTAIKEVAEEKGLDFVFDRSGDILFLYAKDEYDITLDVLEKLK